MKRGFHFLFIGGIVLAVCSLPPQVFGAEIALKNGKSITAKVIKVTDKDVKVDLDGIELAYAWADIASINGITDISRGKISELAQSAHKDVDDGEFEEALTILKKIEELDPPMSLGIVGDISRCYEELKQHPTSLPYIQKEIEKNPSDWRAWQRLGNVYRHVRQDPSKLKDALAAYEKAIELQDPATQSELAVENSFNVGLTYAIFHKWAEALPFLEKAVSLEPDSPKVQSYFYIVLARACLNLGKQQEAITACQKVIEKFSVPEQGWAYHYLGQAYLAMGESAKATESEAKAKEIGYKKEGF